MGLFGKRENAPEDTIENAPQPVDSEKQLSPEEAEQSAQTQVPPVEIDPAVEKRLLRKLDLRLPTLMMFLCECCAGVRGLYDSSLIVSRRVGIAGSKQYRVCTLWLYVGRCGWTDWWYRNAKTAGMEDELHLGGNRYEWLLTIFYIPYIIFEVLAVMWKIIPPNVWAAVTVTGW